MYADYLTAVAKYPEPVFPSSEALEEEEMRDPTGSKMSAWSVVA